MYAIVPKHNVEDVSKQRAVQKAREQVNAASTHMTLKGQSLSKEQLEYEIERVAEQIMDKMPSDFWNEE
ncbi:hypothetical protein [Gayadomonas joobiniege]|uniref:hypothetical protein n=1 Tax=Gayadomonas joobiniege TaxID=1234606 RepID=UPI00035CC3BB|nr:hypothetical protein [Gayadomonas joobiniege]